MSAKRDFISIISTSLARMSNAESPSLRKKVERLGMLTMMQDEGALRTGHRHNDICVGIELKIWCILAAEASGSKRRRSRIPATN